MSSFDPIDFDPDEPPPRPTTPPVRRGFLVVLAVLSLAVVLAYGVPFVADRTGYAWEAGRARAASEALKRLDRAEVINQASLLFRMASTAVAPAVVNVSKLEAIPPIAGGPAGWAEPVRTESGSGVVIAFEGRRYIVTNNHVISGAAQIQVRLGRGGAVPASLVGADPKTDLAVLQVNVPVPVAAEWGDSSQLDIGDWVLAIGSPFELDRTVTVGIVSATGRSNLRIVGENAYEDFIQTDAAINPGNSGGPLINLRGQVVGINTAIYAPREVGTNVGIGFAISAALAQRVVEDLVKNGRVVRGYLGVAIKDLSPDEARALKLLDTQGTRVIEVQPESPAARAGLRPDDVIVAIDGQPVADRFSLRTRTSLLPIGARIPVRIYRDGEARSLEVTIAEYPRLTLMALGLSLQAIVAGPGRAPAVGTEPGLVIERVVPGSPAFQANLRPGMRVVAVGRAAVRTPDEFEEAASRFDPARGIPLTVQAPDGTPQQVLVGGRRPAARR
jgi:serine protease Do